MQKKIALFLCLIVMLGSFVPQNLEAADRSEPFAPGETIDPGAEAVEPCGPTDENCFPSINPMDALTVNGNLTAGGVLPGEAGGTEEGTIITDIGDATDTSFYNDSQKYIAIGEDGFPRMVYMDWNTSEINFIQCLDEDCENKNNTTIYTNGNGMDGVNLEIGSDGFPRIVFIVYNDPVELHFVRCLNDSCSSNNDTIVDLGNSDGLSDYYTAGMVLGDDGFGRIVYDNYDFNVAPGKVRFAQCLDSDCLTKNLTTVAVGTDDYVETTSIDIASDGLPRIAYVDYSASPRELHYVQCTNASCSTNVNTIVDSEAGMYYMELKVGNDDFGRIGYATNSGLKFAQCTNDSCSTNNITVVDVDGAGNQPSLDIASDGLARISYYDHSDGTLNYAACTNASCSSSTNITVSDDIYFYNSMILGSDDLPRIFYNSADRTTFYLARLGTEDGEDVEVGSNIGASGNRFGSIYSNKLYTESLVLNGTEFVNPWTISGDNIFKLSGNFGIGTSSPYKKLSVSGDAAFDGSVRASSFFATSSMTVSSNASTTLTSPLLYLHSATTTVQELTQLRLASNAHPFSYFTLGTYGNDPYFRSGGRMVFFPSAVPGNTNPALQLIGSSDTTKRGLSIDVNSQRLDLGGNGASATTGLKLFAMRGVWSYNHPSFEYQPIEFTGFATDQGVTINTYAVADALVVAGTTGNVGIGTTTPWRTLSVAGTASFSGLTAAGGSDNYLCLSSNNEVTTGASCPGSSERFKTNINNLDNNLETILKLRPVTFEYLDVEGIRLGLIAEEVNLIDPRLVYFDEDGTTPRGIRYQEFIPILAGAIQDLSVWVGTGTGSENNSFDRSNSILDYLITWFEDKSNGIKDFFAKRIRTETLCVGTEGDETCITKNELDALLNNSNQPTIVIDEEIEKPEEQEIPIEEEIVEELLDEVELVEDVTNEAEEMQLEETENTSEESEEDEENQETSI